jgi:hypothetical protein
VIEAAPEPVGAELPCREPAGRTHEQAAELSRSDRCSPVARRRSDRTTASHRRRERYHPTADAWMSSHASVCRERVDACIPPVSASAGVSYDAPHWALQRAGLTGHLGADRCEMRRPAAGLAHWGFGFTERVPCPLDGPPAAPLPSGGATARPHAARAADGSLRTGDRAATAPSRCARRTCRASAGTGRRRR